MLAFLTSFAYVLRDCAVAIAEALLGRRRRIYAHSIRIAATPDVIWNTFDEADTEYPSANIRLTQKPLPGVENGWLQDMYVGGNHYTTIAVRRTLEDPPHRLSFAYLPELSRNPDMFGKDEAIHIRIEPDGADASLVTFARELEHIAFSTRIMAPFGVRQACHLTKELAEIRAGVRPSERSPATAALNHLVWLVLGFLSFWWLVGLADAVVLVLLVLIHELGHALAMWHFRLGVRFMGLVPFIGGIAVPKKSYASDWQLGIVALAGPGFSLLPLLWLLAEAQRAPEGPLASAALMFAIVNGINLLPLAPLDGGLVTKALLSAVSPRTARIGGWLGVGTGLAIAAWLRSTLIAIPFALAALQLVVIGSHESQRTHPKLSPIETVVLLLAYVAMVAVYVLLLREVIALEGER